MGSLDFLSLAMAIISFICTLIVIAVHFILPKTRKHPGQFILIQTCLQFYLDLNYIIISQNPSFLTNDAICYALGLIFSSVAIQGVYYFAILAIEIYIHMKKKFISVHTNRCRIYYTISLLLLIFFIAFGTQTDAYGKQDTLICYIKDSSNLANVLKWFILFFVLILWTFLISSLKINNTQSTTIKKHLISAFLCTFLITLSISIELVSSGFGFDSYRSALLPLTPIGFCISGFRLYNKQLLREVKWKLWPKKMKLLACSRNSLNSFLVNFDGEGSTISEFLRINSIKVSFI
jgi:hypothetical protein